MRPSVSGPRSPASVASDSVSSYDVLDLSKENARYELLVDQAQLESKPLSWLCEDITSKHPLSIDATQAATDVAISFYRNEPKLPTIRVESFDREAGQGNCHARLLGLDDGASRRPDPAWSTDFSLHSGEIVTMKHSRGLGDIRDFHRYRPGTHLVRGYSTRRELSRVGA